MKASSECSLLYARIGVMRAFKMSFKGGKNVRQANENTLNW